MTDRPFDRLGIETAWNGLGGRLAALGGSLVALVAIQADVPPHVAALRGAGAWALLLLVSKFGRQALMHALDLDEKHTTSDASEAGGARTVGREVER